MDACPPATKCAHDFATGAGRAAIEAAYLVCGGPSSPVSRDCGSCVELRGCLGWRSGGAGQVLVFMKGLSREHWVLENERLKEI
jgi:hypothetical protein